MPFSKTGLSLASAATARVKSKVAMVTRFMFGPFEERVGPFHTEGSELGARTSLSEDKGEGGGLKILSFKLLKIGQIGCLRSSGRAMEGDRAITLSSRIGRAWLFWYDFWPSMT